MVEVTAHLATARTSAEPLCAAPNLLAWREVIFTLLDTPLYVVIYMSLCCHSWPICEPVESVYNYLLQRLVNARSLLKDQHDRLSQAKAHKLALDESRQNLETLIENAYNAS